MFIHQPLYEIFQSRIELCQVGELESHKFQILHIFLMKRKCHIWYG